MDLKDLIKLEEGGIEFYSYDPKLYAKGKMLNASMPVFFNPIQEFNRSLSMLVYKIFQAQEIRRWEEKRKEEVDLEKVVELQEKPFRICDAMTASGIRDLRIYDFLNKPLQMTLNDFSTEAITLIQKNIELNHPSKSSHNDFIVSHNDARFLLAKSAAERELFDIIDIDPFGTPNIFIEPAIKAVRIGGMLAITATDTAPLFGVKPAAGRRKYSTKTLRSSFLKEVGLRILLHYVATRAHTHSNYIIPIFSFSADHYVRIYLKIRKGKSGVNKNFKEMGYMQWCPTCDWRNIYDYDSVHKFEKKCPICSSEKASLEWGGPIWIGNLHESSFIQEMIEVLDKKDDDFNEDIPKAIVPSKKKILKILNMVQYEDDFPAGYYDLHQLCDKMNVCVPSFKKLFSVIEDAGYRAVRTHILLTAIKTNLPFTQLREILQKLHQQS